MKLNILIVDDEYTARATIKMLLGGKHNVFEAKDESSMLSILAEAHMDLILLDIRLGEISGIDLIPKIREAEPDAAVIMISVVNGHETIIRCFRLGVLDYLVKPFEGDDLEISIDRAQKQIELWNAHRYNSWVQARDADEYRIIGDSPPMRDLLEKIEQAANRGGSLLITGETGTGKELVARAIHRQGPRSLKPFIPVNCAALQPHLAESELFGHERGAFTGADREKKGIFEVAGGGTLFLDEIGELDMNCQGKLLRVIDDGGFMRLGGTKLLHADVVIYAATNRDLKQMIAEKQFREDLFYRLDAINLVVPPLRERREDIPALIAHLIKKHFPNPDNPPKSIDGEAIRHLQTNFQWQGNVRELRNVVIKLLTFAPGERIGVDDVGQILQPQTPVNDFCQLIVQRANTISLEREKIEALLRDAGEEVKGLVSKVVVARLHEKFPGGIMNISKQSGIERNFLSRIMTRAGILLKDAEH